MNAYTAVTIINVAVVLGSVAVCFASHSAWGLIGFLFMYDVHTSKKDKESADA